MNKISNVEDVRYIHFQLKVWFDQNYNTSQKCNKNLQKKINHIEDVKNIITMQKTINKL